MVTSQWMPQGNMTQRHSVVQSPASCRDSSQVTVGMSIPGVCGYVQPLYCLPPLGHISKPSAQNSSPKGVSSKVGVPGEGAMFWSLQAFWTKHGQKRGDENENSKNKLSSKTSCALITLEAIMARSPITLMEAIISIGAARSYYQAVKRQHRTPAPEEAS